MSRLSYLNRKPDSVTVFEFLAIGHVPIVTRTQEVVDAIEKRFFTRK